jgi:hypothetical protein
MCRARTAQRRSIFSISRTANSNSNEDCQSNTRPIATTSLRKSSTMKLPRYCNNNHNNSHHPFTASSSSSSAAAADALRWRAGDAEQNNNGMTMATTRRATTTAGQIASPSSSKSAHGLVRRCQSANASVVTTSRRHTLPSNYDAIRKSRSHNVSTKTLANHQQLHFHHQRSSCPRADEDEDDEQPSGVRTPELPIPAPTSSRSHPTNGDGTGGNVVDEGDLTRMYDFATWNMYERIVSARRQRLSTTTASTVSSTTSTSTASTSTSTSTTNPRHVPSRETNHALGGGQQCNNSKASSSTISTRPPPEFKSSNQGNKVYGSFSAVTVDTVASASSEAEASAAAMTCSKTHFYCKRSSTVSDCESTTLATADETDKSSTTSSSWSRTDSPGTFPVGGGGGDSGCGNDAFLNPLRTAGNPNCRISHHPSMMMTMMEGVDHKHHPRHQAGYYSNIGGSSMMMNGGVCLTGTTSGGRVVLPGGTTTSSPEDDHFIFQLEM